MKPRTYPDLRTYFRESGDTQEKLSARLGWSQAKMSRVLNGKQPLDLDDAFRLAEAARIPVESLRRPELHEPHSAVCE